MSTRSLDNTSPHTLRGGARDVGEVGRALRGPSARSASRRLCAVLRAAAAVALSAIPAGVARADGEAPSLVVLIVIDQLTHDRLERSLPGGLGRIVREGTVFERAVHDHARTNTCPGHAAIATGRHPGSAGIPDNRFVVPGRSSDVGCVEDSSGDAAVLVREGAAAKGRSPRWLRKSTLGDWLKARDPAARVYAVSGKARGAIILGGHRADGAFWLDRDTGDFTTSRYYMRDAPAWLDAFNGETGYRALLPARWETSGPPAPDLIDAQPGESDDFSQVFPHPVSGSDPHSVYQSPFVDEAVISLAEIIVEERSLGRRDSVDLLALSLSAIDTVGHLYGPESVESWDTLIRLDRRLDRFLRGLESALGTDRILAAVTADHGVLPLPESLERRGELRCPVEGGRLPAVRTWLQLYWHVYRSHSPWFSLPSTDWLTLSGNGIAVNHAHANQMGVDPDDVAKSVETWLEARAGIAQAWSRDEIMAGEAEGARLQRNSFDPERSGDVVVQLAPTCLVKLGGSGTGHGSPYEYDRRVPLAFWGSGIEATTVTGTEARSVDLAPTLARRLGIDVPADLDGAPLF